MIRRRKELIVSCGVGPTVCEQSVLLQFMYYPWTGAGPISGHEDQAQLGHSRPGVQSL